MKEFLQIMRRFLPPYKKYILLNVAFNFLAMFLTLFSFALIIPILEILFRIREGHYVFMSADSGSFKEVALNNFYYYVQQAMEQYGSVYTLVGLAVILVIMTGLKCGTSYLSTYFIIPMRSGVVRDIRNFVYSKIVSLPIGFFTSERKGM